MTDESIEAFRFWLDDQLYDDNDGVICTASAIETINFLMSLMRNDMRNKLKEHVSDE